MRRWREDLHPRSPDGRFGTGSGSVADKREAARAGRAADVAAHGRTRATGGERPDGTWAGSGLRLSATFSGRQMHLKRAGGVWSVYDGDPASGGTKVATAATTAEAKRAAETVAAGGRAPATTVPGRAALQRLDHDTAAALYSRALADPDPDPQALARLEADLERRETELARPAGPPPRLADLDDGALDTAARDAARSGDDTALSAVFAEKDRRYAAAEKARRRAEAAAAGPADAWLYGPDAEPDWATQWATDVHPADAAVTRALQTRAELIDAYTIDLDAARAGRTGRTRDILRRRYDEMTAMALLQAEAAASGHLLNPRGRAAGIDPLSLFSGPQARADAYASEELQRHWGATGRVTFADFTEQALAGGGANQRRRLQRAAGREYAA